MRELTYRRLFSKPHIPMYAMQAQSPHKYTTSHKSLRQLAS